MLIQTAHAGEHAVRIPTINHQTIANLIDEFGDTASVTSITAGLDVITGSITDPDGTVTTYVIGQSVLSGAGVLVKSEKQVTKINPLKV